MKKLLLAFAFSTIVVSCKEEEAPVQLPEIINSPNNMSDTANKKQPMYLQADSIIKNQ